MIAKGIRQRRERLGLTQHIVGYRCVPRLSQIQLSMLEIGTASKAEHINAVRKVLAAEYLSRRYVRKENNRIRNQRAAFMAALKPEAAEGLIELMLARAWQLLDGPIEHAHGCDAILEFLPEDRADSMLAQYFEED